MRCADTTTLPLNETETASATPALWIVWGGRGPAPALKLDRPSIVLGRGEDVTVRLEVPGVSRKHASIQREGPFWTVRDLGSTNGTFLNGERVTCNALSDNDVLRMGDEVGVLTQSAVCSPAPCTVEPLPGLLFGPGMAQLLSVLRRVAKDSLPVVIEGATGVGKEGIARTLHALSGRTGPLHAVNCGALPTDLAEAELFGHRKGAFTGADQAGLGHVRAANGGTLFLDEVYDLPLAIQAKLLRVLQEKEVVPLGETRAISVDVRLVAATLQPLPTLVATRRLREDLAARLAGVTLHVPQLRERRADLPALFHHFLHSYSGGHAPSVDGKLLEHLLLAEWPGNVRELEFMARRLLALHGHEPVLRRSLLPSASIKGATHAPKLGDSTCDVAHDLEQLHARLERHGNVSRAAREVGMSRQRAYRLLAGRPSPQPAEPLGAEGLQDGGARIARS